ncbi:hypothetical protein EI94DRAFT_1698108 [Lactarius quietus]|nr:hypothetical protein EI94DRAFT_1698108 [Lactarius quietus]
MQTTDYSGVPFIDSVSSPQHRTHPVAFVITARDAPILQEHLTEFQNEGHGTALPAVTSEHTFDKKDASKKIQRWFYNHYVHPQCQCTKFTCKWSSQGAFYQLNRDEVLELARENLGGTQGLQPFWTLTPDDQDDYVQAAEEWSQDAPPSHDGIILEKADHPGFPEAAVQNMWDDVERVLDDGISFLKFCPDWKTAPLWEQWTQFCIYCFSQVNDPLEEDPGEVHPKPGHSTTITTKIPISMDMSECPELPTTSMLNGYKTKVSAFWMGLSEGTPERSKFERFSTCWTIGGITKTRDMSPWFGFHPVLHFRKDSLYNSDEIDKDKDEADPSNTGALEKLLSASDAFKVISGHMVTGLTSQSNK